METLNGIGQLLVQITGIAAVANPGMYLQLGAKAAQLLTFGTIQATILEACTGDHLYARNNFRFKNNINNICANFDSSKWNSVTNIFKSACTQNNGFDTNNRNDNANNPQWFFGTLCDTRSEITSQTSGKYPGKGVTSSGVPQSLFQFLQKGNTAYVTFGSQTETV